MKGCQMTTQQRSFSHVLLPIDPESKGLRLRLKFTPAGVDRTGFSTRTLGFGKKSQLKTYSSEEWREFQDSLEATHHILPCGTVVSALFAIQMDGTWFFEEATFFNTDAELSTPVTIPAFKAKSREAVLEKLTKTLLAAKARELVAPAIRNSYGDHFDVLNQFNWSRPRTAELELSDGELSTKYTWTGEKFIVTPARKA